MTPPIIPAVAAAVPYSPKASRSPRGNPAANRSPTCCTGSVTASASAPLPTPRTVAPTIPLAAGRAARRRISPLTPGMRRFAAESARACSGATAILRTASPCVRVSCPPSAARSVLDPTNIGAAASVPPIRAPGAAPAAIPATVPGPGATAVPIAPPTSIPAAVAPICGALVPKFSTRNCPSPALPPNKSWTLAAPPGRNSSCFRADSCSRLL